MALIGSTRVAEILDVTPRMIQRYVQSGALKVTKRTPGGFAKFDEAYIHAEAEKVEWLEPSEMSPGSHGKGTGSRTSTGTMKTSGEPDDKVSTLATLTKRRSSSDDSSSTAPLTLEEMLA